MKALIKYKDEQEIIYPENEWTVWTRAHLDWEIEINGWELVDPYIPPTPIM